MVLVLGRVICVERCRVSSLSQKAIWEEETIGYLERTAMPL